VAELLSRGNFERARSFVLSQARPIDKALFRHVFEDGSPDDVWQALAAFQNADGGFGQGIEPDCRLPDSSALGTSTAFPYLIETQAPGSLPLVKRGIEYLVDTYDADIEGWLMTPATVNNYPRANWWNRSDESEVKREAKELWVNPSAAIVGHLNAYSDFVPSAFLEKVTDKAMAVFEEKKASIEGHDFLCYAELAKYLPDAEQSHVWQHLNRQAGAAILTNPKDWTGYGIRPLWAVSSPESPLVESLQEAVELHLDFEIDQQQPDGSWHPFWSWGQFEDEWQSAKIEWQGQWTVKALRCLHSFGRIEHD
jgi:hypothetical protein